MANDMQRGANAPLTQENPGLRRAVVGVDWEAPGNPTLTDNLALAAILCDRNGKAISTEHFVYFNQIVSADLSTEHLREVLGSDDEQVEISLADVPQSVEKIAFVLYFNEGTALRSLGQLGRCVVRVLDGDTSRQLARSVNLTQAFTQEAAAILAEVYRHNGEWKFRVIGEGFSSGLVGVADHFEVAL